MAMATTDPVRLPPALPLPKLVAERAAPDLAAVFGRAAAEPALRRPVHHQPANLWQDGGPPRPRDHDEDVLSTTFDLIEHPTKVLGQAFGPGSTFSLLGKEHPSAES